MNTRPHQRPRRRKSARGSDAAQRDRLREARLAVRPRIDYPDELPVSHARDEIAHALRDNQVIVVAGETGSGKTTQLPKICMELGYGIDGVIGHTQPRRIAARSVAARIAEETGLELGQGVGFHVRFNSETSDSTRVKVMTDGILLAELQHDRTLSRYDVIIIDEAHERSLNIDFLMGFLVRLLPARPELRVIITSATIDPESFSSHFGGAPTIRVSGRTYPVETRYRPLGPEASDDVDGPGDDGDYEAGSKGQLDGVLAAVDELAGEDPGDILVFLSGEREIRDTAEALSAHLHAKGPRFAAWEIVPLFGRLSAGEQQRVFAAHSHQRIVLATNVAETSLTVPGITYVIDAGTARISRYSNRTKVQRLPIERISQASARQRAGRAGRTRPGICIRLYSEEDFETRPAFSDPEILRTHLASVVLQMLSLGLARSEEDIATFPFLTPPEPKAVRDGRALLTELGAVRSEGQALLLTQLGRKLGALPIDPRMARMIIAGVDRSVGEEVTVIVAALSLQDPRERPAEVRGAADEKHARFTHPQSDFMSFLSLWNYVREQSQALSSSKFRRLCTSEFLNYVRIREWQDAVTQLRSVLGQVGVHIDRPGARLGVDEAGNQQGGKPGRKGDDRPQYSETEVDIHRSLLTGLLGSIGQRRPDGREYAGTRGTRMWIFPGSGQFGRNPDMIMAAELVETSKLWARTVARIEPEWVVDAAGPLIRHQYSEPHWSEKLGGAFAFDRMSLYGLSLMSDRRVGYGKINPSEARELFIRNALVAGQWREKHAFLSRNADSLRKAQELAHRTRDRRMLDSDDVLVSFYDERIPDTVTSAAHFNSWWKKLRSQDPAFLDIDSSLFLDAQAQIRRQSAAQDFPLEWELRGADGSLTEPVETAKVRYFYEPGQERDGVTVQLTAQQAAAAHPSQFSWQVPGLRLELVTALIRSLPKAKRRYFVPAPDVAADVLSSVEPYVGDLADILAAELSARAGGGELTDLVPITVDPEDFDRSRIPGHLILSFEVQRRGARPLRGTALPELRASLSRAAAKGGTERPGTAASATGSARATPAAAAESGPHAARRTRNDQSRAGRRKAAPDHRFAPVDGQQDWTFGTIPETVEGGRMTPALVDTKNSVGLRAIADPVSARGTHRRGVARLIALRSHAACEYVLDGLPNAKKALLGSVNSCSARELADDAVLAAVLARIAESEDGQVRTFEDFSRLTRKVNDSIVADIEAAVNAVTRAVETAARVQKLVGRISALNLLANASDIRDQCARLMRPGLVGDLPAHRLRRLPAYLEALLARTEKLGQQAARDRQFMDRMAVLEQKVAEAIEKRVAASQLAIFTGAPATVSQAVSQLSGALPEEICDIVFDVEELRISLWAPHIQTAHSVSEQRILKALARL